MKKIKILHIITALSVGGAEKVVLDLASKLDQKRFDSYVIAIGTKDGMLPQFQAAGVKTKILYSKNNFFSFLKALRICLLYTSDAADE